MFRKAERKQAKLRLGLCGPSGSGKTYGALMLAKGLGGKIALIDTERGSASLYSDLVDFDICQLDAPFTPARYIQAVKEAEKNNYDILIIDSLSHAWAGEGGVLEMQSNATATSKSQNSYMAWREVTPEQNKLVNTIIQSKLHVICCMRSKTEYALTNDNGKVKPIKIGMAPVQRDGLEFEFDCFLDLIPGNNKYSTSKDRTRVLKEYEGSILSVEHGAKLKEWLMDGTSIEEEISFLSEHFSKASDLSELKQLFEISLKTHPHLTDEIIILKDNRKEQLQKEVENENI